MTSSTPSRLLLVVFVAQALVATPGSALAPTPRPTPQVRQRSQVPSAVKTSPGPKQPRLVSFRVTDGPYLGFGRSADRPTKIEAVLADFDPNAQKFFRPALFARGCRNGGLEPASEPGGNPYKVKWDFTFSGAENSGKQCAMQIEPYGPDGPSIAAATITLPRVQTYTIANTWDLLSFTTPSAKKLAASANKGGTIPCELASVGTAGTFSTGVVNDGGDLSFQLRNGLLREDCEFQTSTALVVRPEYFVAKVDWQFTEDPLCTAGGQEFGIQTSSGQTVTFFSDDSSVFQVRFDATCMPNSKDLPRNSHLYKARLASIEILGPAGHRWQDAFR